MTSPRTLCRRGQKKGILSKGILAMTSLNIPTLYNVDIWLNNTAWFFRSGQSGWGILHKCSKAPPFRSGSARLPNSHKSRPSVPATSRLASVHVGALPKSLSEHASQAAPFQQLVKLELETEKPKQTPCCKGHQKSSQISEIATSSRAPLPVLVAGGPQHHPQRPTLQVPGIWRWMRIGGSIWGSPGWSSWACHSKARRIGSKWF